jgi:hypothetical protein
MLTIRKAVLGVLLGSFVTCVVAAISIDQYFYTSLPRLADEQAGRVVKLVVSHGSISYGSEKEARTLKFVNDTFMFSPFPFLIALGLGFKWGVFHIRKRNAS